MNYFKNYSDKELDALEVVLLDLWKKDRWNEALCEKMKALYFEMSDREDARLAKMQSATEARS